MLNSTQPPSLPKAWFRAVQNAKRRAGEMLPHAESLKRSGNENCCSNILQMYGMNPAASIRQSSPELITISLNFHGLPRVPGDATQSRRYKCQTNNTIRIDAKF